MLGQSEQTATDKLRLATDLTDTPESESDGAGKVARMKWGNSLNSGFQIVPDVLFRCQKVLGLEVIDLVILLNITTHWWHYDDLPHPRPSVIAQRMNLSTRTVERRIVELQKKGYLRRLEARRKNGRTVRPYDLSGLVEKLKEVSMVNLVQRRSIRNARLAVIDDTD
jgi:hypothetical protein